jgi:hypothetical protein
MAQHLCSIGYAQEMAFAAVVGESESERVVGTSGYFLDPQTGLADVAYMVDPEWHGVGLGSCRRAPRSTRGVTASAASRPTCWSGTPPCWPSSSASAAG